MVNKVLLKIHKSYRQVVALCDAELLGKKFEDSKRQLHVNEAFYGGEELEDEDKIIEMLNRAVDEDATFNFVGKRAVKLGIKAGIVEKSCVIKIQKTPHALALD